MASNIMLPIISDFLLKCRINTLHNSIKNDNMDRFHVVATNTVDTINQRTSSEVHDGNLTAYIKNVEIAQLLCFCECQEAALQHLDLALDVIKRDLAAFVESIPTHVFTARLKDKNGSSDSIGSLAGLPNGVLWNIARRMMK